MTRVIARDYLTDSEIGALALFSTRPTDRALIGWNQFNDINVGTVFSGVKGNLCERLAWLAMSSANERQERPNGQR